MAIDEEKLETSSNTVIRYPRFNQSNRLKNIFDAVYHSVKEFIKASEQDILMINGKLETLY